MNAQVSDRPPQAAEPVEAGVPVGGPASTKKAPTGENTGRWTKEEHSTFLDGLALHGKEWKKIASMIESRTVVQIRTHAQKYFQKLAKTAESEGQEVPGDMISTASTLKQQQLLAADGTRRRASVSISSRRTGPAQKQRSASYAGSSGGAIASAGGADAQPASESGARAGKASKSALAKPQRRAWVHDLDLLQMDLADDEDDRDSVLSVASPSSASSRSSAGAPQLAQHKPARAGAKPERRKSSKAGRSQPGALRVNVTIGGARAQLDRDAEDMHWVVSGLSSVRLPQGSPTGVDDLELYPGFGSGGDEDDDDDLFVSAAATAAARGKRGAAALVPFGPATALEAAAAAEAAATAAQGRAAQEADDLSQLCDSDSLDDWLSGHGSEAASPEADRDADLLSVMSARADFELEPPLELAGLGPLTAFVFDGERATPPAAKRRRTEANPAVAAAGAATTAGVA